MNKKSWALGMIIPLAAVGGVVTAPAASATPNHVFQDSDRCNGDRDRLALRGVITADHDDIKLTVRLNTTHNRSHDDWRVTVRRVSPNRLIIDESPSGHVDFDPVGARHRGRQVFEADDTVNNRPGRDHFVARARNLDSGRVCVVHLTVGGLRDAR